MARLRNTMTAAFVGFAVLSALSVYAVWWERDRVWLYAWLIPASAAFVDALVERLRSRDVESPTLWLGRRLAVFALAALVAGWASIPVLWEEALIFSRDKSYLPRIDGRVWEFQKQLQERAAQLPWVIAAVSATVAVMFLRSRYVMALAIVGLIHACGCWIYAKMRYLD